MSNKALFKARPFANAHPALLVVIYAAWIWSYGDLACKVGPDYLQLNVAVSTIFLAFWVNHAAVMPVTSFRDFAAIVLRAIYDLLALIFLLIPVVLFTPAYQCYMERAYAGEILTLLTPIKTEITQRAVKSESLKNSGSGLTLPRETRIVGGMITPDGAIVAVSEKPSATVILSPEMHPEKIQWTCRVYPQKAAPILCRD